MLGLFKLENAYFYKNKIESIIVVIVRSTTNMDKY